MDSGTLIALLTALGAGTVLGKLIDGIVGWLKGRHGAEQTAWEQRDAEARYRRLIEEALHETRRYAHNECGVPYDDLPEVPARDRN